MSNVFNFADFTVMSAQKESPPELPYGVRMIGAPLEWSETKGKGIKVAVIDTGAPNHPDIQVTKAVDFGGSGYSEDWRGHGTHVSGTIAANGKIKGVAPEVELYCLKVAKSNGLIDKNALPKALLWCKDNGMDVVNMSIGGATNEYAIEQACKACYDAGIVVVCSAGNLGRDYGVMYPGKYPTTFATAAIDITKDRPGWSAVGGQLDVAAAGVQVWSTWLNGEYALLDGTSMAAPHITGAVALLQAKAIIRKGKKITPEEIRLMLRMYAEDLGQRGPDEYYGFGVFSFGRFEQSETIKNSVTMQVGNKTYSVNGEQKEMDVAPFIQDERIFVPARYVAEGLGANVEWIPETKTVKINE